MSASFNLSLSQKFKVQWEISNVIEKELSLDAIQSALVAQVDASLSSLRMNFDQTK